MDLNSYCLLHILEELKSKIQDLYNIVCELEEEKYDWEMKIERQVYEVCLPGSMLMHDIYKTAQLCFDSILVQSLHWF